MVPESNSIPRKLLTVVLAEARSAPPASKSVLTLAEAGADPRAASALMSSVPPPITTELASPRAAIWKVLVPVRAKVPAPYLWSMPDPLMTPPRVKVPAVVVILRVPARATAPVPRFRAEPFEPVKVKSAKRPIALFVVSVRSLPDELSRLRFLSSNRFRIPVPRAPALFRPRPPWRTIIPAEIVLARHRVVVLVPNLTRALLPESSAFTD